MKVEATKPEVQVNYEKINSGKKIVTREESVEKVNNKNVAEKSHERKDIEVAVEKINKQLEATNTKIKFKIHDSAYSLNNKVSIKVIDEESEKVIAEIPSEEAIEMSERMQQVIGFLFDECK